MEVTGCDTERGDPASFPQLQKPGEEPMLPRHRALSVCCGAEPQDTTLPPVT